MKIAILGTRGIPNHHGGFEQFAEYFSGYLVKAGHQVYVYNSSLHPFQGNTYNGAHIIHCKDLEDKIGTAGQFVYDYNCIKDARKRHFDVLLQLGYTSNSVWHKFLPKGPIVITNMDGLEWKRTKYSKPVQKFLKHAEKLAVQHSDYLVADSMGIQSYLKKKYGVTSKYIPYGADLFKKPKKRIPYDYGLFPYRYNMLIARMEPENNIEVILDGVATSNSEMPFIIIGNYNNKFGRYLRRKFKNNGNIQFLGGIYKQEHLSNLRYFSNLYFHGHSVGGTNPSLLEAMASKALLVAHDNEFNKAILESNAFYFSSKVEVTFYIDSVIKEDHFDKVERGYAQIAQKYSWEQINATYLEFFEEVTR